MSADAPAIRTRALRKEYQAPGRSFSLGPALMPSAPAPPGGPVPSGGIVALESLDLEVRGGEFFGLLGPNGAGKSTTLGILTTRVRATAGEAWVAGADVVRDEVTVKRLIGVVPQRPNPDRSLNVIDNLLFHAAYFGLARGTALERARLLLGTLGLTERADSRVDHLSGGQQQRLMIARALMHEPQVLFLDEPTVGLDPQARLALWDILRELRAQGRTIVMTTHYMEEADRLCERVAIIDRGRLLALDSPAGLKARAPGGTLIELTLDRAQPVVADEARALPGVIRVDMEGNVMRAYAARPGELIAGLVRVAEHAGCGVTHIHLAPPSLETLFISLTGRKLD